MDYRLVLNVAALLLTVNAITYDGTPDSWTQYAKWNLCPHSETSLFMTLKAEESDGLLLYMDDGGTSDYLLVQLIDGNIQVEYRFGPEGNPARFKSEKQIPMDTDISIELTRNRMVVVLKIDSDRGAATQMPNYGGDLCFGDCLPDYRMPLTNSYMYIGGVPPNIKNSRRGLSIQFPNGFKGDISDVEYKNCDCSLTNPLVMEVGDSLKETAALDRCFNQTDPDPGCVCRVNTQTNLCSCGLICSTDCSG